MKNKKIIIILGCLIILIGFLIIFISSKKNINIDLEKIEKNVLVQYDELNLVKQDKYNLSEYFGINIKDEDFIFLTDYVFDEEKPVPFSPNNLLIVINTDNQEMYDILYDYINVEIYNSENLDRINLYKTASLELKDNYLYFIIRFDNNINKIIGY